MQFSKTTATNALHQAREQWVQGQVNYHWGLAQRMHGVENGLESVAKGLLVIVLACASLVLWLEVTHHQHNAHLSKEEVAEAKKVVTVNMIVHIKAPDRNEVTRVKEFSHPEVHPPAKLNPLVPILSALAAALPAFIAALGGIMFQSEAKRLELRSESMFHGLQRQSDALSTAIGNLELPGAPPGGETWEAATYLRKLAEGMIIETSEWKALYQMHEIRAG